jgi:hypothetical protein
MAHARHGTRVTRVCDGPGQRRVPNAPGHLAHQSPMDVAATSVDVHTNVSSAYTLMDNPFITMTALCTLLLSTAPANTLHVSSPSLSVG